jgi:hypothetical protein
MFIQKRASMIRAKTAPRIVPLMSPTVFTMSAAAPRQRLPVAAEAWAAKVIAWTATTSPRVVSAPIAAAMLVLSVSAVSAHRASGRRRRRPTAS